MSRLHGSETPRTNKTGVCVLEHCGHYRVAPIIAGGAVCCLRCPDGSLCLAILSLHSMYGEICGVFEMTPNIGGLASLHVRPTYVPAVPSVSPWMETGITLVSERDYGGAVLFIDIQLLGYTTWKLVAWRLDISCGDIDLSRYTSTNLCELTMAGVSGVVRSLLPKSALTQPFVYAFAARFVPTRSCIDRPKDVGAVLDQHRLGPADTCCSCGCARGSVGVLWTRSAWCRVRGRAPVRTMRCVAPLTKPVDGVAVAVPLCTVYGVVGRHMYLRVLVVPVSPCVFTPCPSAAGCAGRGYQLLCALSSGNALFIT